MDNLIYFKRTIFADGSSKISFHVHPWLLFGAIGVAVCGVIYLILV